MNEPSGVAALGYCSVDASAGWPAGRVRCLMAKAPSRCA